MQTLNSKCYYSAAVEELNSSYYIVGESILITIHLPIMTA